MPDPPAGAKLAENKAIRQSASSRVRQQRATLADQVGSSRCRRTRSACHQATPELPGLEVAAIRSTNRLQLPLSRRRRSGDIGGPPGEQVVSIATSRCSRRCGLWPPSPAPIASGHAVIGPFHDRELNQLPEQIELSKRKLRAAQKFSATRQWAGRSRAGGALLPERPPPCDNHRNRGSKAGARHWLLTQHIVTTMPSWACRSHIHGHIRHCAPAGARASAGLAPSVGDCLFIVIKQGAEIQTAAAKAAPNP